MIGVDILDNHEGDGQFEESGIEEGRHLQVLLSEEGQDCIDFLNFSLPYA